MAGSQAKRSRPAEIPEISAELGLTLELPGGFAGRVIDLREDAAAIELDDGALMVVRYGERVRTGGKTLPLGPPKGEQEACVEALKRWRLERARADGVPAFVVFHDSTLQAIAERRPSSLPELSRIDGLGPVKLERYGGEVLEILKGT
jgi:superfamily II DNA helicase RecQ